MSFFGGGTKVPATGYYALPNSTRTQLNQYQKTNYTLSQDPSLFAPSDFTADQKQAFGMAGQTLDPDSIAKLVASFTNPNDASVINDINKQATGANSTLNQEATAAGAFGGNRQALGANDIDESRLNEINTFKQGAYDTALQTGLTTQQQQIANLLATGGLQQQQNTAVKQAPIVANNNIISGIQNFLTAGSGGSAFGTPSAKVSGGGIGGIFSGALSGASAGSAFGPWGALAGGVIGGVAGASK